MSEAFVTVRELREAIRDFEKRPHEEACRLTELLLAAAVSSAPRRLAKAVVPSTITERIGRR